jgi:NitT/TauT family transport system substrate-binding protein
MIIQTRRQFVTALTVAGASGAFGLETRSVRANASPEVTKIRLIRIPGICIAPQYVAADLLSTEGFTEVSYIQTPTGVEASRAVASGDADFTIIFSAPVLLTIDAGAPVVLLGGVHVGCFELFATDRVRSIRDLKGKTVAVQSLQSSQHIFLSSMAAYVGLDPSKDINWVTHPSGTSIQLLAEGRIDAMLAFPPEPQELRARKIGHVVVNSGADRPWSQYFCCMVAGNREFVRRNPIATKRVLRAVLKASELCALEPERAARTVIERGYATNYDYALQTMRDATLAYGKWRQYDPEDTVRFYALRLREAGMLKSNPQKIVGQATDWRFLKELRQELKS